MLKWSEESIRYLSDASAYNLSHETLADHVQAALFPNASIVEGGCGLGYLSLAMQRRGFCVTSVDCSPLALAVLRENAQKERAAVQICAGDVFALPAVARFDYGLFCFFGDPLQLLAFAKAHCREGIVVLKGAWEAHRFTRSDTPRRFSFARSCEALDRLGISYFAKTIEVDLGQPFRSIPDAVEFFRLYGYDKTPVSGLEKQLRATEREDFPYYLEMIRPVGMIVIRTDDIKNTQQEELK